MLAALVNQKLREENLTLRDGAKAVGVSHTTLARIANGSPADIDTLISICNWLGISPASALNSQALGGPDKLAASLAILLEKEPSLASILSEALADVEAGTLSPQDVQEVVQYAAYRLGQGKSKVHV